MPSPRRPGLLVGLGAVLGLVGGWLAGLLKAPRDSKDTADRAPDA